MPLMKTLVLYHANCPDGFGAALAAWKHFGNEAEYVPVQYGKEPPDVSGIRHIPGFGPELDEVVDARLETAVDDFGFLLIGEHGTLRVGPGKQSSPPTQARKSAAVPTGATRR